MKVYHAEPRDIPDAARRGKTIKKNLLYKTVKFLTAAEIDAAIAAREIEAEKRFQESYNFVNDLEEP